MGTVLLFLFIFGLFGWGIWRLLRLTRDTVGENSPLKVQRTYYVSAREYFTRLDMVLNYCFYLGFPLILYLLVRTALLNLIGEPLYIVLFVFSILVFLYLHGAYRLLCLDMNYWEHTREKTLFFDPVDYSITVVAPNRTLHIKQGDVLLIESYYSDIRPYTTYNYYRLKLNNDDEIILTNRSKGLWALFEYCRAVPHKHFKQRFPLIR